MRAQQLASALRCIASAPRQAPIARHPPHPTNAATRARTHPRSCRWRARLRGTRPARATPLAPATLRRIAGAWWGRARHRLGRAVEGGGGVSERAGQGDCSRGGGAQGGERGQAWAGGGWVLHTHPSCGAGRCWCGGACSALLGSQTPWPPAGRQGSGGAGAAGRGCRSGAGAGVQVPRAAAATQGACVRRLPPFKFKHAPAAWMGPPGCGGTQPP